MPRGVTNLSPFSQILPQLVVQQRPFSHSQEASLSFAVDVGGWKLFHVHGVQAVWIYFQIPVLDRHQLSFYALFMIEVEKKVLRSKPLLCARYFLLPSLHLPFSRVAVVYFLADRAVDTMYRFLRRERKYAEVPKIFGHSLLFEELQSVASIFLCFGLP